MSNPDQTLAVVGSPSTNAHISLDLLNAATQEPLVGSMLYVEQQMTDGIELGLGTVTEVTTNNKWHTDPVLRGIIKDKGEIPGMTGAVGDTRAASVNLQACYKKYEGQQNWAQSGPTFRMSPSTGAPVRRLTNELVDNLIAGTEDLHHLGHLHGTDVRAPLNIRDFSGSRGAWHAGIFGRSGSGKANCIETRVPTPSGWTRMGDLVAGDLVLDESGNPTEVLMAHPIMLGRPCYEIEFSDGSVIVADGDHNWFVETEASRKSDSHTRMRARNGVAPTLLPMETTERLLCLAGQASASDVVTIAEAAALAGVGIKAHIMGKAASRVASVGSVQPPRTFTYKEQQFARTRSYPLYPTVDLLTALAERCGEHSGSKVLSESAREVLLAAAVEPEHETIPVREVARLLGLPKANGTVHRAVRTTGVRATVGPWVMTQSVSEQVIVRPWAHVATYPKAEFLQVLASMGSAPRTDQSHKKIVGGVLTTEQMLGSYLTAQGKANYSVPVAKALQLPKVDLSIEPYTLGAWLGDGSSWGNDLVGIDHEVAMFIEADGYRTTERRAFSDVDRHPDFRTWTIHGIRAALRQLGLLKTSTDQGQTKFIPAEYLRASEAQRRALLAGLLDTDGTVAKQGTVQFDNTNERLARGVFELVASLGYRPTMTSKRAMLNGVDHGPAFRVSFTTDEQVFGLNRKQITHKERTRQFNPDRNNRRYITRIERVETRPVRCITVDSPNSLYLVGEAMIPTHNTAMASYMLGSQMRHPDLGMIIIDPQGQWSTEQDLPFSLQAWAAELGRDVVVRRVSEDLRLDKDATLFGELLSKTKFLKELMKMSAETQELLTDELVKALRGITGWEEMASEALLDELLRALRAPHVLRNVYADGTRKERLLLALSEVIGEAPEFDADGGPAFPEQYVLAPPAVLEQRRTEVLAQFRPLHNLFSKTNPSGGRRHSLWGTIQSVFDRPAGHPAPLVILDMSTAAGVSWLDQALAGEERAEAMESLRILDQDSIKAAILRRTCQTLKNASEDAFRGGKNLNTMVVFDEAWRYAPAPQNASEDEIKELSKDLAGYARDTRKFGIGWFYITQTPRSLNNDIWDQLSVRVIGHGLSGAELSKVAETLDGPEHLNLYRAFAPPDATNPRVYPFMLTGPVSPLSFTQAPLFIAAPTNFDDFRNDNHDWIAPIRLALGRQVINGTPTTPTAAGAVPASRRTAPIASSAPSKRALEDAQRIREHSKTGGVNPRAGVGLSTDQGFSSSLSAIDDEEPPF